jgi:hypothetical protein
MRGILFIYLYIVQINSLTPLRDKNVIQSSLPLFFSLFFLFFIFLFIYLDVWIALLAVVVA